MSPALRRIAAAAALSLSLVALPSLGQQAGDAAAGATKSATCTACHGLNGNSANPEWPSIAGQNAAYSREQIAAIRAGKRPNVLMQPIVQTLTDQDIADLAAHFAQQTPTGLEADPSYWKAGQKLYRGGDTARGIPACMACHGPVGRGNPAAGLVHAASQAAAASFATGLAAVASTQAESVRLLARSESSGTKAMETILRLTGRIEGADPERRADGTAA